MIVYGKASAITRLQRLFCFYEFYGLFLYAADAGVT